MVGSKERPMRESMELEDQLSPDCREVNSPAELHVCRGDITWVLKASGWMRTGLWIGVIKVLIALVSLRSRRLYPRMLPLEGDHRLAIVF